MMNGFVLKRASRKSVAVFIAAFASYFFNMSEAFWMPLTVILVMQTEVGVLLHHGVQRFVFILLAIFVGTLGVMYIHQPLIIFGLAIITVSACCYFSEKDSLTKFSQSIPSLFAIILLITVLLPANNSETLYMRLYATAMGAAIGIVVNLVFFPEHADTEFRKNVIPVLIAYSEYLTAIINLLYRKPHAEEEAENKKNQVEKQLQTQSAFFPEWVYEPGFNMIMRQGHRHFLVMTERVGQILFAMHYVARHSFDPILLQDVQDPLFTCVAQAKNLIGALITVLNLNKLKEPVSDLGDEVEALEVAFKNSVPPSLELLDMSKDYVYLAALVRDIKDLRIVLINLAQALYSYSK